MEGLGYSLITNMKISKTIEIYPNYSISDWKIDFLRMGESSSPIGRYVEFGIIPYSGDTKFFDKVRSYRITEGEGTDIDTYFGESATTVAGKDHCFQILQYVIDKDPDFAGGTIV